MSENKTRPNGNMVDDFLEAVPDPDRREDAKELSALMERVSGERPAMWGTAIIGFGSYHYRYESGCEGDMARISFSPRSKELVLYGIDVAQQEELLSRLGKCKAGKGCLYIKRMRDVDQSVLERLLAETFARNLSPSDNGH